MRSSNACWKSRTCPSSSTMPAASPSTSRRCWPSGTASCWARSPRSPAGWTGKNWTWIWAGSRSPSRAASSTCASSRRATSGCWVPRWVGPMPSSSFSVPCRGICRWLSSSPSTWATISISYWPGNWIAAPPCGSRRCGSDTCCATAKPWWCPPRSAWGSTPSAPWNCCRWTRPGPTAPPSTPSWRIWPGAMANAAMPSSSAACARMACRAPGRWPGPVAMSGPSRRRAA